MNITIDLVAAVLEGLMILDPRTGEWHHYFIRDPAAESGYRQNPEAARIESIPESEGYRVQYDMLPG